MSAGKHTPGPWAILPESRGFIIVARNAFYDVAIVRDVGNEDNKKNARLIAAAPQLLEALELLADLLPDPKLDTDDVQRKLVMKARVAIAAAESQQ